MEEDALYWTKMHFPPSFIFATFQLPTCTIQIECNLNGKKNKIKICEIVN